ncbi:LysR family transcriptional regulator [Metallibacterium sp.]|jgi:DNA-binding transcriptional LysR family regulator|uniref:LysR family transcriptional regulator n=1 Tax=Metallibacterium sp. TaxID=2940281 RepID=UPI0026189B62|nr:LysR family transcriptional regulator [Metallibacterium sp.]
MDRLDSMRVLVEVVNAGSLSAAARRLRMPIATVSRKLSELEGHIKTRLVIRSTRQLTLTDAGAAYVVTCKRILEDIEQAERQAAGEYTTPKGDLVVTAPIVLGRMHVLPIITEFLKAYPEINIRLVLGDRWINLLEEHIDLALRIGELPDSSLVATKVGETQRVVCASPRYLAAHGTPHHPSDLCEHACITFESLASSTRWHFAAGKESLLVPVHSRLAVSTAEAAIDAAIAELGITQVMAYQIAKRCGEGLLEKVLLDFEPHKLPIHTVHAGQGLLPLKVRAFIDFTTPRLRLRLSETNNNDA